MDSLRNSNNYTQPMDTSQSETGRISSESKNLETLIESGKHLLKENVCLTHNNEYSEQQFTKIKFYRLELENMLPVVTSIFAQRVSKFNENVDKLSNIENVRINIASDQKEIQSSLSYLKNKSVEVKQKMEAEFKNVHNLKIYLQEANEKNYRSAIQLEGLDNSLENIRKLENELNDNIESNEIEKVNYDLAVENNQQNKKINAEWDTKIQELETILTSLQRDCLQQEQANDLKKNDTEKLSNEINSLLVNLARTSHWEDVSNEYNVNAQIDLDDLENQFKLLLEKNTDLKKTLEIETYTESCLTNLMARKTSLEITITEIRMKLLKEVENHAEIFKSLEMEKDKIYQMRKIDLEKAEQFQTNLNELIIQLDSVKMETDKLNEDYNASLKKISELTELQNKNEKLIDELKDMVEKEKDSSSVYNSSSTTSSYFGLSKLGANYAMNLRNDYCPSETMSPPKIGATFKPFEFKVPSLPNYDNTTSDEDSESSFESMPRSVIKKHLAKILIQKTTKTYSNEKKSKKGDENMVTSSHP